MDATQVCISKVFVVISYYIFILLCLILLFTFFLLNKTEYTQLAVSNVFNTVENQDKHHGQELVAETDKTTEDKRSYVWLLNNCTIISYYHRLYENMLQLFSK